MSTKTLDFATGFQTNLADSNSNPASDVTVTPSGNLAADDVQEALEELQADVDTRAPQATTYTKTEVDDALDLKADQATTYTKAEVDQQITDLVGGAPGALDTLNELAQALNDDANFAATVTNELAQKADIDDVYTKTATDTLLDAKADEANPSFTGYMEVEETAAPASPAASKQRLYIKSTDGKLYKKDSAGTEKQVATTDEALTNPMTTTGDMIKGGASGVAERLAAGTAGQVLTMVSGAPVWKKGTVGTTTNDDATSGDVGEYIESTGATTASISSGSVIAAHSYSLPAGDWDVWGHINFALSGGDSTSKKFYTLGIAQSVAFDEKFFAVIDANFPSSTGYRCATPVRRVKLASTTTIYLVASQNHITGTAGTVTGATPTIFARRRR